LERGLFAGEKQARHRRKQVIVQPRESDCSLVA
jgi:hypothetical protein